MKQKIWKADANVIRFFFLDRIFFEFSFFILHAKDEFTKNMNFDNEHSFTYYTIGTKQIVNNLPAFEEISTRPNDRHQPVHTTAISHIYK